MRRGLMAALYLVAAVWFVPGTLATLEGLDEGHLVYFASRVAEGALPYRDFHHMYGPGVFFLNGLLLALGGQDLLAVRLGLIAVKATLSVAVARAAAAAAGTAAGLLAWGLLVGVWGAPLWVFATPYASTYQVTLDMLALVALVTLRGRPRQRALLAGLCLGMAATFRQTGAALAGIGVLFFLLHEGTASAPPRRGERDPLAVGLRLVLLGIGLAVAGAYVRSFSERRAVVLLGTPLMVLGLHVARRVLLDRGGGRSDLVALAWTAVGTSAAPAAFLAYYATQGAAGALLGDTVWGLPPKVAVLVPLPAWGGEALAEAAVVGLVLVAVEVGRRGARAARRRLGRYGEALAGIAVLGALAVALRTLPWDGPSRAGVPWTLTFWLPPAITWLATVRLVSDPSAPVAVAAPIFLAAALLPALQPVGDIAHVLLALPAFLPPLAELTARYADRHWPGRWLAGVAACGLAATLVAPFVFQLGHAIELLRAPIPGFRRATGVRDPGPWSADLRALVDYLERTPEETRLLVLPDKHIIDFLSGRRSALEKEDFAIILGTYGHVSPEDARALVDQEAAIALLEREPVLVVSIRDDPGLTAERRVFPQLLAFVDARFREVARFGPYEVLARGGDA
jgi:hypothetical protein